MARRKKEDVPVLSTEEEMRERIKSGFSRLRRLMLELADLKAEHIKPVTDAITKEWRSMKAETGTEQADLKPWFHIYMRDRQAEESDNEADAQRIKANLKRVYQALALGETVDFLTALEEEPVEDDCLESDVAQAEEQIGAEAEQSQGEASVGPVAETETAAPDADWGDDHLDQKEGDDGATAGFAYREGERAAREGIAIKELLKANSKHHLSAWAKSAKAGYEAELKRQTRERKIDESAGLEVAPLNVVPMVSLPKLIDGVATSSGDAA